MASIVVIFLPSAWDTGVEHERIGCPSRCTVHAPHKAMPQPNFVPVMPRLSRSAQRIGVSESTSTFIALPLTFSVIIASASLRRCLESERSHFRRGVSMVALL